MQFPALKSLPDEAARCMEAGKSGEKTSAVLKDSKQDIVFSIKIQYI